MPSPNEGHTMSDDIIKLPVKQKAKHTSEKLLAVVHSVKCWHGNYLIDKNLEYVECGKCGKHLNPMYVLGKLADEEDRDHWELKNRKALLKEASDKLKWKCGHCSKFNDMTKTAKWRASE